MVKLLITIYLLLFFNAVFSQDPNFLKKYSYSILAIHKGYVSGYGTGFFYKRGESTFIVSNYHVFSGVNSSNNEKIFDADSIVIRYTTKSLEQAIITLNLDSYKQILARRISYIDNIDLFSIEIPNLPVNGNIYYINSCIDTSYLNKRPIELYCFGFSGRSLDDVNVRNWGTVSPTFIKGKYVTYNEWLKEDLHKVY